MTASAERLSLEEQIAQWRVYLRHRRAIHGPDVEELESHLRDQVAVLTEAGLTGDEAFTCGGQTHGQPRRALAGVRARALGAAVETASDRSRSRH